MGYQMSEIRIETVRVVGRFRRDLGDIDSLATSIASLRLMQPIVVTPEMQLIAGERRLAACRKLGWETIPALIVDNLNDASLRLTAERDENTERKPMSFTELVALGKALEALERPKAAERQAGPKIKASGSEDRNALILEDNSRPVETREVVGKALGMSGTTFSRAKAVVEAAEAPGAPSVVKAIRDEMEATRNVAGAFDKLRGVRSPVEGSVRRSTIAGSAAQRRVISKAETALSGICHGLSQVTEIHPEITSEEAAQWVDGLSEARRVIESLIRRLRERSNERA